MLNVCPNCHYIGEDQYDYSANNLHYGVFTIIFGSMSLLGTFILDKHLIYKLVALFVLIGGILLLRGYIKGRVCPNCNYKGMIPMQKTEAIELVKQYDLQPGTNKFPDTFKEQNPNSPFKAPES